MATMKRHWITLTTDFGLEDWFVGTMHGVISGIAPEAKVINLNHGVPPADIQAGAFSLAAGFRFFPKGTLHVAVVDPGVGSDRRAIAVRTEDYIFIGPDNGVLSVALEQEKVLEIRQLTNRAQWLPTVSQTFQARDLFAPVAAHLANGARFSTLGPRCRNFLSLALPKPQEEEQEIRGAVVYVDRFGNAITNIPSSRFLCDYPPADVFVRARRISRVHDCYQAVAPGKPVCVPGSTGFLEIAVNQGNAEQRLKLKVGTAVQVQW